MADEKKDKAAKTQVTPATARSAPAHDPDDVKIIPEPQPKPEESKAAKFVRLANFRLAKLTKVMEGLRNLANRNNYQYNGGQKEYVLRYIDSLHESVEAAYNGQSESKASVSVPQFTP